MQVLLIADNEAYILFDEVEVRRCRKEIMDLYAELQKSDVRETASDSGEAEAEGDEACLWEDKCYSWSITIQTEYTMNNII